MPLDDDVVSKVKRSMRSLLSQNEGGELLDYEECIPLALYVIASGEVTVRSHHGPCHSGVCSHKQVHVLCTAPNTLAWDDPDQWSGGRWDDVVTARSSEARPKFEAYWKWLTEDSMWSQCFLEKDLKTAETEGVLMDCSLPSNLVMQALIATREPHEYPNRVELWYDIVEQGGDPHIASLLMEQFVTYSKGGTDYIEREGGGDIHDMYNPRQWGDKELENFVKQRPSVDSLNRPLTESGDYDGVHNVFGGDRWSDEVGYCLFHRLELQKHTTVERKIQGWGKPEQIVKEKVTSLSSGAKQLAQISNDLKREYG